MYINITRSEKGSNTGSVRDLAYYLEKENQEKPAHEKNQFFSQDRDDISTQEVISALDSNNKGLKNRDGKFYLINISPSQKELDHIGNDPEKLKSFTREVMDAYARNFQRDITGKDLLYFAKIEHQRHFKGYDKAVKDGLVKQGEQKPGNQTHIHVIVSRKDREQKRQFSPLSNHRKTQKGPVRGGFDRKAFYTAVEEAFDRETGYKRSLQETFQYRNTMKYGNAKEKAAMRERVELELSKRQALHQIPQSLQAIGSILRAGRHVSIEEKDPEKEHEP